MTAALPSYNHGDRLRIIGGERKGSKCIYDRDSCTGRGELCWVKPLSDPKVTWLVHSDDLRFESAETVGANA